MNKNTVKNYNYNKKRQKKGKLDIPTVSERYRIYNFPNEEDKKIYHEPRFMYKEIKKAHSKNVENINNKKSAYTYNGDLNLKPICKDVYSILNDECNAHNDTYESEESAYYSYYEENTSEVEKILDEYENKLSERINVNREAKQEGKKKKSSYNILEHPCTEKIINHESINEIEYRIESLLSPPNLKKNSNNTQWETDLINNLKIIFIDLIYTIKNMNNSHLDQTSSLKDKSAILEPTSSAKSAKNTNVTESTKRAQTKKSKTNENLNTAKNSKQNSSTEESDSNDERRRKKTKSKANINTSEISPSSVKKNLISSQVTPIKAMSLFKNLNNNIDMNVQRETCIENNDMNVQYSNDIENTNSNQEIHNNRIPIPMKSQPQDTKNRNKVPEINEKSNRPTNAHSTNVMNKYKKTPDNRTAQERRLARKNHYETRKQHGKIVITVDEQRKHLLYSPKLVQEIENKLKFVPRSTDKVYNRLYIYTSSKNETDEIMSEQCEFFKGCHRKNIDTNGDKKPSFIIHNISAQELRRNENICQQFENIGIVDCAPVDENDENEITVKAFVSNNDTLKNIFIKYYESGIKVNINNEEINLNIQPNCGRPLQCFKCWKIGHVKQDCDPRAEPTCGKCGLMGHEKIECMNFKNRCAFCNGAHMATDRKNCEKYKKLNSERKADAIERITGIRNFSKKTFAKLSFAEAASYTKDIETQNRLNEEKFATRTDLTDTIKSASQSMEKAAVSIKTAEDTLATAREYLETVNAKMKQEAMLAANAVYSEIAQATNVALKSISQEQACHNERITKLEFIVKSIIQPSDHDRLQIAGSQFAITQGASREANPDHCINPVRANK
jgi:hypothetical protein